MIGKKVSKKPFEPVFFFGYGSLLRAQGINGRGMRHRYTNEELFPCRLRGYKRGMSAFFGGRNFYGLLPDKDSMVNGVIFPIASKTDYRALLGNEGALKAYGKHQVYWTTRVTDQMEYLTEFNLPAGWRVMTLVCHSDKTEWGQVSPWYVDRCDRYAHEWSEEFYEDFLDTGGWNMEDWNNYHRQMKKNGRKSQNGSDRAKFFRTQS